MNLLPPSRTSLYAVLLAVLAMSSAWGAIDGGMDLSKERQFWSFQVPVATPRPAVKHLRWPRQDLDYFVLARLEPKRLAPSGEAEKRTLIRRATFDLTGLPPTPGEVDRKSVV